MKSNEQSGRRSKRVHSAIPALIVGKKPGAAMTDEINANGMFLRTTARAAIGSLLQVELGLPDDRPPLRMFVTTRFVGLSPHGFGIGVEIHVIAPEERKRWLDYYMRVAAANGPS